MIAIGLSPARAQETNLTRENGAAAASESGEAKQSPVDPYAVPDGTPEQILRFVEELRERRPRFRSREELVSHFAKVQESLIEASRRLLAHADASDETAVAAVELSLQSHFMLVRLGRPRALESTIAAARELAEDPRPVVAAKAQEILLAIRIGSSPVSTDEERAALITELLDSAAGSKLSPQTISPLYELGMLLERSGKDKAAAECYEKLSLLLKPSEDSEWQALSEKLDSFVRRLRLPGNVLDVAGQTLDGTAIDWESYRGKVVLVDFWATWCGPCMEELPNVLAAYRRFHGRGFEVVGVSLDENVERLQAFVARNEIPWTTLVEADPEQRKWNHPLAVKYGVAALPTTMLVGRDGRVVSLNARGPELMAQLEKLLGPGPGEDAPGLQRPGVPETIPPGR